MFNRGLCGERDWRWCGAEGRARAHDRLRCSISGRSAVLQLIGCVVVSLEMGVWGLCAVVVQVAEGVGLVCVLFVDKGIPGIELLSKSEARLCTP